jgi:hypothetical protein
MSFTAPIGGFINTNVQYRPSSVVDTAGTGTITNSSNVYSASPSDFGTWSSSVSGTTYSVFSLVGATVLINPTVYVRGVKTGADEAPAGFQVSTDGGSTYPYSQPFGGSVQTVSVATSGTTTVANIKIKVYTSYSTPFHAGGACDVYDAYVQ